jgi:hypothetical protein
MTMVGVVALFLAACDASADKEMAKRNVARNEMGRAFVIYTDYNRVNKKPPLIKTDLVSFDSNFPTSVEYYPDGYRGISWAIFARPWDNKVMLITEKGDAFILEQCDKL